MDLHSDALCWVATEIPSEQSEDVGDCLLSMFLPKISEVCFSPPPRPNETQWQSAVPLTALLSPVGHAPVYLLTAAGVHFSKQILCRDCSSFQSCKVS